MTEQNDKTTYQVKNVKYGEKTVRGRVVGRSKTVIPEEEFLKLAQLHCTWKELSDFYSVPVGTLRTTSLIYTKKAQLTRSNVYVRHS